MKKAGLALTCLVVLSSAGFAQRLGRTVIPQHYDLTLTPDLASDTFTGVERIEVGIQEPTRSIELHALEIVIDRATVRAGGVEQAATVTMDTERQTARLAFEESIPAGPATLAIEYRGLLNEDLRGFYIGVDSAGEKYAASQMESTDARRAFPGFDEPWMKATFAVTLVVDEGLTAISNGAAISDSPGPAGKHTVRFATTPRMSTYLVALVVGRFDCLEDDHEGLPIRVCASPDKVELGRYALEATKAMLAYYDDYFDYAYPFGKLDQIAVADFDAGAMENTGAIIYRETALLLDPERASINQRRRVAGVIAHEIAHMWFGDLVTMQWWNDIWLNEGFATFMTNKAVGNWKPEWNLEVENAADSGFPMGTDVLSSTRQIRQQATTPAEIDALFDGIAYGKTAAVLRTVESYIGEEAMRRGIAGYMKRHAYGNTSAEDFYDALSAAADKDVAAVMRSYVNQPGLPVVSVRTRCEGDETVVSLAQQRFFADRSKMGSAGEQLWTIPVCFGDAECVVLAQPNHEARLPGCRKGAFANWQGRGYYLTAQNVDDSGLVASRSAQERLVLLRDQWYLVRIGQIGIGDFLDLVAATTVDERESHVVDEQLGRLEEIEESLVADGDRAALHAWMQRILAPLAVELGWHPAGDETPTEMELRAAVHSTLGQQAADPGIRAEARRLAEAYLEDTDAIHPTMASAVLAIAAREGDEALWERYHAALQAADSPEEAARFRAALAKFDHPALRRRGFDLVLSDEIRSQDRARFLGSMISDAASLEAVFEFVTSHWDELLARLPETAHQYLLPYLGAGMCSEGQRAEFERLAASVALEMEPRRMAQARERIANCLDLKSIQQEGLSSYLELGAANLVLN